MVKKYSKVVLKTRVITVKSSEYFWYYVYYKLSECRMLGKDIALPLFIESVRVDVDVLLLVELPKLSKPLLALPAGVFLFTTLLVTVSKINIQNRNTVNVSSIEFLYVIV